MPNCISESERRFNMRQAIANTVIEGHKPSPEFLADCEKVVTGQMTTEEAIKASVARHQNLTSCT
jgi:hypothetical protein